MVSLLFLDDRLWSGGFDACGYGKPSSQEEAYRLAEELYSEGEFLSIWVGNRWVGTTGVLSRSADGSEVMMGRTLVSPDFWGQRVNSAAKKLLLTHLFSTGVQTVRVTVAPSNRNSLRALEKIGFVEDRRGLGESRYVSSGRPTVYLSLRPYDYNEAITETIAVVPQDSLAETV